MARKRKTTKSGTEWRRVFAEAARRCREEAKRRGIKFQECVREELRKHSR